MLEPQYMSFVITGFLWAGAIVGATQLISAIWTPSRAAKVGIPLLLGALTGLILSPPVLATMQIPVAGLFESGFFGFGAGMAAHTVYAVIEGRIKGSNAKD